MARVGRVVCIIAFLVSLLNAAPVVAWADEYNVKAAFLLNFAKLVEWPAESQPADGMPVVLGVMASRSVTSAFTSELEGTNVGGHPMKVRSVRGPSDVKGCHILFVASNQREGAVLAAAQGHAALSVGETDGFASRGGVINFISEGKRLRFEINTKAADRARLKISSRLLRLAILVSEP